MRNCAIIHPLHLELETIPSGLRDEQVLFLSDIFPTGYMGAENCGMERGDTIAVWGCGPVGQFAIQSAWMLGAGRVIAIDRVPARLRMAEKDGKAETVNFENEGVYDRLMEMTKGRGPDRCIDAVGTEAHAGGSFDAVLDKAKVAVYLGTDRPHVLREAIMCCRKGGTISIAARSVVPTTDRMTFASLMIRYGGKVMYMHSEITGLYKCCRWFEISRCMIRFLHEGNTQKRHNTEFAR